jgi:hypothetical protein
MWLSCKTVVMSQKCLKNVGFLVPPPWFSGALIKKKIPEGGGKWKNHVESHVKKRFLPLNSSTVVL